MTGRAVAVVGATGAVGREMVATLARRAFPVGSLRLLASARSAGTRVATPWGEVEVEDLAAADPAGIEIALFSAGVARAREHAPRFAAAFRRKSTQFFVVTVASSQVSHGRTSSLRNQALMFSKTTLSAWQT